MVCVRILAGTIVLTPCIHSALVGTPWFTEATFFLGILLSAYMLNVLQHDAFIFKSRCIPVHAPAVLLFLPPTFFFGKFSVQVAVRLSENLFRNALKLALRWDSLEKQSFVTLWVPHLVCVNILICAPDPGRDQSCTGTPPTQSESVWSYLCTRW